MNDISILLYVHVDFGAAALSTPPRMWAIEMYAKLDCCFLQYFFCIGFLLYKWDLPSTLANKWSTDFSSELFSHLKSLNIGGLCCVYATEIFVLKKLRNASTYLGSRKWKSFVKLSGCCYHLKKRGWMFQHVVCAVSTINLSIRSNASCWWICKLQLELNSSQ